MRAGVEGARLRDNDAVGAGVKYPLDEVVVWSGAAHDARHPFRAGDGDVGGEHLGGHWGVLHVKPEEIGEAGGGDGLLPPFRPSPRSG